ncbi:hypothetical protein CFP65_3582 [Kitasatospora sp. MMS16-BH015]|uniref:C40 family peptidase n=1 Tax=Kitasatospora sp. MMS16-BH015 TaxID=2018025 RepID=UPI000CA32B70|nr:C40 family peptidase [Kitasatospora sp. MMS16-BH015]AUG78372.1 hypothetical protein CFP65_3582 [Kitasatospora sp. MMS16-BH015]
MNTTTDQGLLGFTEAPGGPCVCTACTTPARAPRPSAAEGRIHRAVRRTCIATTVLAGAGVIGLTAEATTANAMPAPSGQGWDGTRYWFKNTAGEWRYTSHQSVYLDRTGAGAGGSGSSGGSGGGGSTPAASSGIRQGWDGSVYWFRNSAGQWRYTSHRDIYLDRTGQSGERDRSVPQPPPATTDDGDHGSAVDFALAQLGKPYVWGGNGPSGYDCSGLVQQAFRRAGVSLPRVADDQYAATTPISADDLRSGDLLFWSSNGRSSGIHHVAIYLGGNRYVEAPRPGRNVRVSTLSSSYSPDFFGRP